MNFDPSDDQRLLRDAVERLVAQESDMEHRRRSAARPEGWSRDLWGKFAALGFLGLTFAEADGGIGGGPTETMIVMEALGRGLVLEPYFATAVLGGACLRQGASAALRAQLVPRICAGSLLLAFAWTERHSRYDPLYVETTARRDGDAWILDGAKSLVMHGDVADKIVVTARASGGRRDREGLCAFLVDGTSPGLSRTAYRSQDGIGAAEIALAGVRVDAGLALGEPGNAAALIERVLDEAIAARCAEAVGVMAAMQRLTVDHLKSRRQFGRPIGDFQALQHRAVDQLIALEQARSMALFAAMMVDAPDAAERRRAIAAAKVQIGRSGRRLGEEAIQMHGGIGMTMEHEVGHYFKRMTMIDRSFGDADWHLAALARAGGLFIDDD